jgi:sugar/nucleoside kinase (ribokinase family)
MHNLLFGVACVDIYTTSAIRRPGCGILHNAYHLQQLGSRPLLLTRIGATDSALFRAFFNRNHIAVLDDLLLGAGPDSASIEIAVQPSGEAVISNFVLGVWENFRLHPAEEAHLAQADHLHTVLAKGVPPEFLRASRAGLLQNALVSADFLSFRGFTLESFAELLAWLDVAFIGWKDDPAHPTLTAVQQITAQRRALAVITLGERGVLVLDGRTGAAERRFFAVDAVPVRHNTNGCGDAFIACFLHEYWRSRNLEAAVEHGKIGGALATGWPHALPETAYVSG